MEIRNLITFVRLSELGSFSRTAQQLGYSQSAVTMQIRQLEEELHTPLFERIGRQTRLTPAGKRLLPYALQILECVRQAREIEKEPETISGPLCLGTCESFAASVLPVLVEDFHQSCPQVELRVVTPPEAELFQLLKQNDIDILLFVDEPVSDPAWIKVAEKKEKFVFVAATGASIAEETGISLEKILEEPMVLTEKGISYRRLLDQRLAARGLEARPFLEIGNTDVILDFVRYGQAVSFLPEYVVAKALKAGELVVLEVEETPVEMEIQLVYHRNKYLTPQMSVLLDILADSLQDRETK